jgi:hypothetical protein
LKLVCYGLRAIAYSDDEPANIYECKKPLVEIRWIKEVGKSKKEVDIPFQDCDHGEELTTYFYLLMQVLQKIMSQFGRPLSIFQGSYIASVSRNEQLSENSPPNCYQMALSAI